MIITTPAISPRVNASSQEPKASPSPGLHACRKAARRRSYLKPLRSMISDRATTSYRRDIIAEIGPQEQSAQSWKTAFCRFDRPSSNHPTTTPSPCLGIPSHPPHLTSRSLEAGVQEVVIPFLPSTRLRDWPDPVRLPSGYIAVSHLDIHTRLIVLPPVLDLPRLVSQQRHRHQLTLLLVPLTFCLSVHFLSLPVAARDPESPGPRPDRAVQQLPLSCPPFCERYQPASPTSNASQLRLGAVVALAPGQAHCYSALVAQPHHPTLRRPSTARPPS
jgi:hypothetical protein